MNIYANFLKPQRKQVPPTGTCVGCILAARYAFEHAWTTLFEVENVEICFVLLEQQDYALGNNFFLE